MKKVLSIFVAMMLLSVGFAFATPADVIKDEADSHIFDTGDGGKHSFVDNELGRYHCVLKPMGVDDPVLKKGWVQYGPFWMKCNAFGPK